MSYTIDVYHGRIPALRHFLDYDHFDKFGGVPLHQHSMKVAGFARVDPVLHTHPTAVLKAVT